jgi:nucleoside-diphosphate-sugar epimerase
MKILVTGSEGMVGKILVNELKKKNEVIEFDYKKGNNILDKKHLNNYLRKVDGVIHLAGIIDTANKDLWKINVEGTKNLLEESINARVKKFVFLSSTGVYGITKGLIDETSDTKPETIYDKSKLEAENILLNRQEETHINIIRSAMIFGNNDYWKKMIKMLEKNYPLPCNGKNSFQIIYVKELVNAIIKIFENGEPSEIYLISGKEKLKLKEFCQKIKNMLGKGKLICFPKIIGLILGKLFRIKLLNKNNLSHLTKERNYNLDKIKSIGFEHKYDIEKAIKQVIKEIYKK